MAKVLAKTVFFFLFLSFLAIFCSGTLVGFSYDVRENSPVSSPTETLSFLKKNGIPASQIRVFVADHRLLDSFSNNDLFIDLIINENDIESLQKSKASAVLWLRTHLTKLLPRVKITSIIVSSSTLATRNQLHLLLPILNSMHSALKSLDLDQRIKVSVVFPLSMLLEKSDTKLGVDLRRVVDFIGKSGSFIVVETSVDGELNLGDRFVQLMVEKAASAAALIPYTDVPMILNVRSSAVPSAVEVAKFSTRTKKSIEKHALIVDRICEIFAEITPVEDFELRKLNREEKQIISSSYRELLSSDEFKSAIKTTVHDNTFIPTPTIITVPATNPATFLPTNPVANPVTTPITVPSSTPITVPSSNPSPPTTSDPITTPVTVPTSPITNPVTTYPPPPGGTPITTPTTAPATNVPPATTISPAVSGQSWCVAKTGASDASLQVALDYACGIGGADCSAIQQSGSCYNPNTLHDHASYAFNSYYQKNPVPSSCDFGGTAMTVNNNPSTGPCSYPSSSLAASTPPAPPTPASTSPAPPTPASTSPAPPTPASTSPASPTPASTSPPSSTPASTSPPSSSSVLNTNNGSSNAIFGLQPPADSTSNSVSILANLHLVLTFVSLTSFLIARHLIHG